MHSYKGLLELRESKLALSFADCLGLSPVIAAQFTLEMCVAATNRQKFTKKPYFGGFKVIDVCTPKKHVSSACYDTQQVCVYLQPLLLDWSTVAETTHF